MEGRPRRFVLGYGYAPRFAPLGGEDRFIGLMKDAGAEHVELIHEDVDLAERLVEKGFSVSFHCPEWWETWKEGEDTATEWVLGLLQPMSHLERSTRIAFIWHAAAASPRSVERSTLFSDSVGFFKLATRLTAKAVGNADVCLENLTHGASKTRIGDTPEELIEFRRAMGRDEVKFCFDIGHYVMGFRTLPERTIPREFLENVAIVHLHGVEGKNRPREKWWDHYCLKENSVPWESHFQALLDTGWRGTIVLEAWRDLEEDSSTARSQIGESLQRIDGFLEKFAGEVAK